MTTQKTEKDAMRQAFEGYSDRELELLAELQFMFSADCDPQVRSRSAIRQQVAQELLDERRGIIRPAPPPDRQSVTIGPWRLQTPLPSWLRR